MTQPSPLTPAGPRVPQHGYAVPRRGYAVPPPGYAPPGHVPPGYAPPGHVPAPPPLSPAGQPLANFGDRLLAQLLDGALFSLLTLLLAAPALIVYIKAAGPHLFRVEIGPDGMLAPRDFLDLLVPFLALEGEVVVVSYILGYLYYVEMMFRSGQSFGKKMMKIKVVPVDPDGRLSRSMAAKRFLVQAAGGLVPGLFYVDGLWQLWDKPHQQCLHDKFAKTLVVKVPT